MKTREVVWLFLFCRLILLVTLPLEGLRGFGDLIHFYRLAGMGLPMIDYWVEFPPVFPYLSMMMFSIAGGKEHSYDYLIVILMTLAQAGSLAVLIQLVRRLHFDPLTIQRITWVYFGTTLVLPYGWWYFDALGVLALLVGLLWLVEQKTARAGLAFSLGVLIKFFPLMVLPMIWRWCSRRQAALVTGIVLGVVGAVYAIFLISAPEMTMASLRSQGEKGSWETIWAMVDGNYSTGNFGPEEERYDPDTASLRRGNPPRLPAWLTLIPFAALGAWLFRRVHLTTVRGAIAFLGVTWCIFLMWSPGYSPQWVLYLLPLILVSLPVRTATLFTITLVIVNVLEWPILLSRGYNWGLWLTVSIRTLLLILLAVEFWSETNRPHLAPEVR